MNESGGVDGGVAAASPDVGCQSAEFFVGDAEEVVDGARLVRQLREGHDGFFQSFAYLSVKARNTVGRVEIVAIEQEVCSIAMVGGARPRRATI